jgi:hypothetical protein
VFFSKHNWGDESKEDGIGWHVGHTREKINAYVLSVLTPDGKRPFGRPRHGWENNIKGNLKYVQGDVVDWFRLVQDRGNRQAVTNMLENFQVL